MEKPKFEDLFKDAFTNTEATPSDSVWTNIELDLEKASGTKIRKRLLFFQLLAAASMVFAAGLGSIYYINTFTNSQENQNSESLSVIHSPEEETDLINEATKSFPSSSHSLNFDERSSTSSMSSKGKSPTHNQISDNKQLKRVKRATPTTSNQNYAKSTALKDSVNGNLILLTTSVAQNKSEGLMIGESKRNLRALYAFDNPKLKINTSEPDPGMVMLARLRDEELKFQQEEKRRDYNDKVWASVGMAAGNYNPNSGSSKPTGMRSLNSTGTKAAASNPTSGTSYSVGASVGGKISRRFILQGGLSYLTQTSGYTSSTAMGKSVSLNEFTASNTQTSVTSPYDVNSSLQFLSMPLQAGYILLDRDLSIQLNGGVATDFFLQAVLTSPDNSLETLTYSPGDKSPYRTVNFSGLVGTEVSYKIGKNYRLAVNPGMRYALNSIYKADINSQSLPITFDIGLNFRYIFN